MYSLLPRIGGNEVLSALCELPLVRATPTNHGANHSVSCQRGLEDVALEPAVQQRPGGPREQLVPVPHARPFMRSKHKLRCWMEA